MTDQQVLSLIIAILVVVVAGISMWAWWVQRQPADEWSPETEAAVAEACDLVRPGRIDMTDSQVDFEWACLMQDLNREDSR